MTTQPLSARRPFVLVGSALLWWLGTFFVLGNIWILTNFGTLELDQFVYHVVKLPEVIKPLSTTFVVLSALAVFGIPTLVALASVWWMRSARLTIVQPFTRRAVSPVLVAVLVPALVFGVSAPAFAANVGVFSLVQNSKPSPFVEAFYEPPQYVVKPVAPTNLVMIYVESLENTYRNEELFGENLMDSLDAATTDWVEFEDFREVRGTGWTIAGIVASQCGVLLKEENSFDLAQQLGLKSINRIGERVNEFMPGITCLGDVLQASGYQNVFLGGADPEFAGKGKFLAEHGYSRVLGRPHWESLGETEFTKWGLYDDDLLRHAKRELDSLHASGEPFNLTVLTVDTHRPEGHLSPTCAARGATELTDIVACTSDMLADFVHYMEREGYLENTAVVITGDHLTMPNVVQDVIDQEENRTIYNRFYSPRPITPNRDELMHFSIFPTVLDMLGFGYPGRGLALGVSALRPLEESELTIYDVADLDDKLRRPSDLYDTFWGVEPSSSSQRD